MNYNEFSVFKEDDIELIENKDFIEKIENSQNKEEYIKLETLRKREIQKIIQNEKIDKYNENQFNYVRTINSINGEGQPEKNYITYGQIFTMNYQKNTLNIIDKKLYEGHFEKINEYNFSLNDVGIVDKEIKVILNNISEIKQKCNQKNDSQFLLYILANRKKLINQDIVDTNIENEIDNLFKVWNITEKYYSYEQYKIYLNLYEEVYIDYLKNNSNINLSQYDSIRQQMKEKRNKILKGE